jgi:hypothetical protein
MTLDMELNVPKFADTEDHAYTDDGKYEKLNVEQRIENADSFAYVVISIALNQLIKDLEQFLKSSPGMTREARKRSGILPMVDYTGESDSVLCKSKSGPGKR